MEIMAKKTAVCEILIALKFVNFAAGFSLPMYVIT